MDERRTVKSMYESRVEGLRPGRNVKGERSEDMQKKIILKCDG